MKTKGRMKQENTTNGNQWVCPNSKKGEMFLEDGKIQNLWVLGL
jgi:hypothetical protein